MAHVTYVLRKMKQQSVKYSMKKCIYNPRHAGPGGSSTVTCHSQAWWGRWRAPWQAHPWKVVGRELPGEPQPRGGGACEAPGEQRPRGSSGACEAPSEQHPRGSGGLSELPSELRSQEIKGTGASYLTGRGPGGAAVRVSSPASCGPETSGGPW
jgi:hypothetical protein